MTVMIPCWFPGAVISLKHQQTLEREGGIRIQRDSGWIHRYWRSSYFSQRDYIDVEFGRQKTFGTQLSFANQLNKFQSMWDTKSSVPKVFQLALWFVKLADSGVLLASQLVWKQTDAKI